ncbi:MAG: EAL domain-containing protein [Pseudomonadota bacterium]
MTGWQKQARVSTVNLAWFAAIFLGAFILNDHALAQIAVAPDGTFVAVPSAQRTMIWQMVIGGFVVFAFLGSIILWVMSALQRAQRSHRHNTAFVHSSLNKLSQGMVMVNRRGQVIFVNDHYLNMYRLSRSDLKPGMTSQELIELRHRKGVLGHSIEEFRQLVDASATHVTELPDGRSISVQHRTFTTGGMVSIHDDCTDQRAMSKQLSATKNFLESVIDNIPVCVAAKTIGDGRYILANRAFEQFLGLDRGRVIDRTAYDVYPAEAADHVTQLDKEAIDSPTGQTRTELWIDHHGLRRLIACNRVIARNDKNEPEYLISLFEDITERRSLSQEIKDAKKFLELVVDNVPVALIVKRLSDSQYVLANRGAEAILSRSREDVIGLTIDDVYNERDAKFIGKRDEDAVRKQGIVTEEHPIQTANGLRLFLTRRMTVLDETGRPQYLINTNEDITDRRETESRMAHMAYHDSLTELPNRAAFLQALSQMIDACEGTDEEFAVLSVDLDRLKEINDVFGHEVGDRLLIEVSRRIQAAALGGVVARLSGDEFGLIIDGEQPKAAADLAKRLSDMMQEEFVVDGRSVRIGLTTGISVFPRHGNNAEALLANADAALFRAKAKSRGSVSFYEAEMDQKVRDRRALHQDLSAAIRNGELSLHYQPQILVGEDGSRQAIGFEALARWTHPVRGNVSPGEFIPLAEESGLIVEMGEWILREACREAASWPKPLQVAVNLSPAQFMHSDVVALVHSILLETGLSANRLELEITEGVLIDDMDRGLALLRRLKALGVHIAMDDFGSGYSSLTYLQAFPFDKIKIDRTFVMNLGRNPQSAAIIRAIVGLGEGLNILIVAEGVETQEQLDFLRQIDCRTIQGYFTGKPGLIHQYASYIGRAAIVPAETARLTG